MPKVLSKSAIAVFAVIRYNYIIKVCIYQDLIGIIVSNCFSAASGLAGKCNAVQRSIFAENFTGRKSKGEKD